MLTFIRVRLEASRLARTLRQSLLDEEKTWKLSNDDHGGSSVTSGKFTIMLVPRRLRVLDSIYLYLGETEVWLPLVARLRLRNAVRLLVIRHAAEQLPAGRKQPVRQSA